MELALGRLRWEILTTPEAQKDIAKAASCTSCGLCAKRCPYELDTPRLVKENWDFYRNFVKEKGISCL
jgi:Fe-S oxidoreductase